MIGEPQRFNGEYVLVMWADYQSLLKKIEELTRERDSAENRWRLAMRRLHERFGDSLAIHLSDIEALLDS